MIPSTAGPEYRNAISVKRMQESDRYTIEHLIPSKELMFRAAMGVFRSVNWEGKRIAILTGSGNNGGDGYALAGILKDHGFDSDLILCSEKFSDDGKFYYDLALQKGVSSVRFSDDIDLSAYEILVDCLLGTGFKGIPRESMSQVIKAINAAERYVVSVDINSGMNGDTGEAVIAVRSDLTVSIGYFKKGLFLGEAPQFFGDLTNVDIGIVLLPETDA